MYRVSGPLINHNLSTQRQIASMQILRRKFLRDRTRIRHTHYPGRNVSRGASFPNRKHLLPKRENVRLQLNSLHSAFVCVLRAKRVLRAVSIDTSPYCFNYKECFQVFCKIGRLLVLEAFSKYCRFSRILSKKIVKLGLSWNFAKLCFLTYFV